MTTGRRRLVGNSLALLINQLTQNATSLLLSIAIARVLGPYSLGQYALAFTYYFIFMTMSSQGLKTLLTREMARDPQKASTCLVSGSALQLAFSLLAYAVLVLLVLLLPYRQSTRILCWIVGFALIPYGLSNITESIFQAHEKMHLIAYSTVPVYLLRLVGMYVALKLDASMFAVGGLLVASEFIILAIEWILVLRLLRPVQWRLDRAFIIHIASRVRTFLAIEGVSVFKVRMQVLILSLLAGETVVGLYSAITQLLQPFQLLSQSLAVAILPTLARLTGGAEERARRLVETVIAVLLVVAVPMVIGFLFIGGPFLRFLYRDQRFLEAGAALVVVGLTMLPLSFTRTLSYLMMARGYERINLRTVVINTIIGLIATVLLVSQFGMMGAAFAALIVELSAAVQFLYAVRVHFFAVRFWPMLRWPLIVGATMVLVFTGLQIMAPHIVVVLIVAGLAYVAMATLVAVQLLDLRESINRRLTPLLARLPVR